MKKIEHLPVNWVNGLKLNNGHFFETYYNMVDTVRHSREGSLTSYDFGFGENPSGAASPVELEVTGDTPDTACIRLKSCNALTRNGYPILYDRELYGEYVPTAKVKDAGMSADKSKSNDDTTDKGNAFYVILSANPYKLLPVGLPDPEVTPLHHPYALPEISLQLMPTTQVNKDFMGQNCIIAGKGVIVGGLVTIDTDYIPSVQRVCHDGRLSSFLDNLRKHVQSIYDSSLAVSRKNARDSRRDKLMDNTSTFCNAVQGFYAMHNFYLQHLAPEQPPIFLVRLANELACRLQAALHTMPEREREYLLQYFQEWTSVSPADFQLALSDVENVGYLHSDIRSSLQKVDNLMKTLEKVFKKMSELEYVGLMRENIILSEDSDGKSSEERRSKDVW